MGYRPTIICGEWWEELDKFYGYVELNKLKSIDWLIEHHKLEEFDDNPDVFNWSPFGPKLYFTAEEFREFFDLYEEDRLNNKTKWADKPPSFSYLSTVDGLKDIYDNDQPKYIEWG